MKKIYLIYLFLALSLLPFFQYQFNPDASAYIGIAQKYWTGNFYQAINGYWSPLYSWLILPFFALKIPFPLGAKILNILLGLIGVVGVNRLLNQLKLSYSLKLVGGLLATLFLLKCALIIITPDLLATVILTFYLVLILEKKPLISTIVGALAYLAKAYNFYFILLTFIIYQLYSYLNQKTKTKKQVVVKQTVLGLLIFFLISIGWIIIIILKYHQFTISTAWNYNYLVINPYHWGLPIHNQGLIPPVNPTALSAWEDPSFHSVNKWHPFINSTTLIYQLLVIKNNLVDIIKYYQQFAALSLIIIITFLIKIFEVDSKLRLVFLLLIIYPLGYLPLAIQDRYLWFSELLILILGIKILASLLKHTQNKNQRFLILFFFILFFIKPQFSEIRWYFNCLLYTSPSPRDS